MIVTEPFESPDRNDLVRTYSNEGKYIIQNGTGAKYTEAIDPISAGRIYEETDEDIPVETDEPKEDIPVIEAVEE